MNEEALKCWFEDNEIPYERFSGKFVLGYDVSVLSPQTLGEISACDAQIRVTKHGDLAVEERVD